MLLLFIKRKHPEVKLFYRHYDTTTYSWWKTNLRQPAWLFLLVILFIFLGGISAEATQEIPEIKIKVNGSPLICETKPFLTSEGKVFVPLRVIGNALGVQVRYHQGIASLIAGQKKIELQAGLKGAWIEYKLICFDSSPLIKDGHFYVPLRLVSELLGAEVNWQGKGVEINFPGKPVEEIVLNFAGDTTLAWFFKDYVKDRFTYPFARLEWFKQADISMLNLENPITTRGEKVPKQFNFRMPPYYTQVLLDGGVDLVNLANNHVGDYGSQGVLDTLSYLKTAGIRHVGAGENLKKARSPVIFKLKGQRIGFLGYFGGKDYAAADKKPGTSPTYEQYIIEDIRNLKQKTDVVIVNFHWGIEKSSYPEHYQNELAHKAIDAGADLIIGHHPHVLQGIEKYKNGFVVYSLGNFIFGGNSRREHDTIIFQLIIKGEQKIPVLIPVRVKNWQPYGLKNEEGKKIINSVRTYSKIFTNPLL